MNFYYLREFSNESKLANISLVERLILSSLLTSKIYNDDRNLVDIIINFDHSLDFSPYQEWNFYKEFIETISKYMKDAKGHIGDWIIENYKDKNVIHKVSINYDDLEVSHKDTISKIACKAFMLSCANHSISADESWFSFNLYNWNKSARLQKKRTIEDIERFADKCGVFIEIIGNKVKILNKRAQKHKNKEEQENKEVVQKVKKEFKEISESTKLKIEKESEELLTYTQPSFSKIGDALHLDDDNLSKEMVLDYIDTLKMKNNIVEPSEEKTKIYRYFENKFSDLSKLKASTNKISDECIVYHGDRIKGDDWQTRKATAEENLKKIQNKILKFLTKLYDQDKKTYKIILDYVCQTYEKLFTNF